MKTIFYIAAAIFLALVNPVEAQRTYNLPEIVRLANAESLNALAADNRKENRYWQYRVFRSNYAPQLSLNGNLPEYFNDIRRIPGEDNDRFAGRNQISADVELNLSQSIALTGGRVFLSSQLQRIDFLAGANQGSSYATTPLSIGFIQPIFAFNRLKWDKNIEPIRYEESKKAYVEDIEETSLRATELYFNLLLAQVNLQIAQLNRANNDTIFQIANGRYELGKIAENELLQLELNVVNSEQEVARARLDLETSSLALNTFVRQPGSQAVSLAIPEDIPQFEIEQDIALTQAKANRQQYLSFKRRKLEADREVAQARAESGLRMDLFGRFGLNKQSEQFRNAYVDPNNQQSVQLGFQIPVVDWGRQKAAIQTAVANQELVNNIVAQDEINFEQDIFVLVRQFEILRSRVDATRRASDVAQRSYDIANKRYLVAKISITDLNLALQQKDRSRRDYLEALRDFWTSYYQLRLLTLYDFERNEAIMYE